MNTSNESIKTSPLLAVDTVVFSIINKKLSVLLIKIGEGPYKNKWAIPGGLVKENESLDDAAIRVLNEKTSIKNIYLEQLYTFGDPKRDSRKRSVSVAYFALINNADNMELTTQDYYDGIEWVDINKLPEMAFDHKDIVGLAKRRLEAKLMYSNIAYSLVSEEFTLTQLQKVYEIILGKKLDKRNFRKKIEALDIIETLDKKQTGVGHRPAQLCRFKKRKLEVF